MISNTSGSHKNNVNHDSIKKKSYVQKLPSYFYNWEGNVSPYIYEVKDTYEQS